MKNQIIFKNWARVGRRLGVEIKTHEIKNGKRDIRNVNPRKQLEESKEWAEFKKKYAEYFETVEPEKLAEFYEKTGLRITHLVKDKKNEMTFLFTMFGWTYEGYDRHAYSFAEDKLVFGYKNLPRQMREKEDLKKLPWAGRVHMEHILVCSEIDDINALDFKFDEKDIMKMSDDATKHNYELYVAKSEEAGKDGDKKDESAKKKGQENKSGERAGKIKQEFYDTFSEHVALYENGELYVDDKLYDKNVRKIFFQDSGNKIIIFDNNTVEMLSAYEEYTNEYYLPAGEYDKIELDENMLALLDISRGGFDDLLVIAVDFNLADTSVVYHYENVGDISITNFASGKDNFGSELMVRLTMTPSNILDGTNVHLVGLPTVIAPFADD